jgi:hypothetical protein
VFHHLPFDPLLAGCRDQLRARVALIDAGGLDVLAGGRRHGFGQATDLCPVIGIGGRDVQRQEVAGGYPPRPAQLRSLLELGSIIAGPLDPLG